MLTSLFDTRANRTYINLYDTRENQSHGYYFFFYSRVNRTNVYQFQTNSNWTYIYHFHSIANRNNVYIELSWKWRYGCLSFYPYVNRVHIKIILSTQYIANLKLDEVTIIRPTFHKIRAESMLRRYWIQHSSFKASKQIADETERISIFIG